MNSHDLYNTANFPEPIAISGPWTIYRNADGKAAAIPAANSGHSASHFGDMHHVRNMIHTGQCEPYPKHTGEWKMIEKKNPLAVHGLFGSYARARQHLNTVVPEYVRKGYFMDKNLTASDFTIVPA